jgi:predicted NBD/HSP70 family sugar kinase
MTIGTGVSHTFVFGGTPWRGAHGNAIVSGAPLVEIAASGPALAARAGKRRAEEVLAAAEDQAIVEEAALALGIELARLVNALDPAAVVIGGGLGLAPGFIDRIVARMRPEIYADATRDVPVLPSSLGASAGVIGAAVASVTAP